MDALEAAGGVGSDSSSDYSPVRAALNARTAAATALAAAQIKYQGAYDALKEDATAQASGTAFSVDAYMEYLAGEYKSDTVGTYTVVGSDPPETYTHAEMSEAYTELTSAKANLNTAEYAYNTALNNYYDSLSPDNSALKMKVDEAKAVMDAAQETYDSLVAMQTAYETAKDNVVTYQAALETAIRSQKLETLELQRMQTQIAEAAADVAELAGGGSGGSIYAEVDGVVTEINVTAGNTTDPSTALATIEVPDRGYSVSLTVTKEQAQKVSVGDSAEISTGWWGSSGLSGTLASITPDPTAPNQNRILVFTVRGDVESGTSVTVSIGQKSKSYEVIVPNSAVREDSNGSFVLVVVAKSTPLGNRYVATRADVQLLSKDDTITAVSGGIYAGDYVITTSTMPLESGMQVRLADDCTRKHPVRKTEKIPKKEYFFFWRAHRADRTFRVCFAAFLAIGGIWKSQKAAERFRGDGQRGLHRSPPFSPSRGQITLGDLHHAAEGGERSALRLSLEARPVSGSLWNDATAPRRKLP